MNEVPERSDDEILLEEEEPNDKLAAGKQGKPKL